MVRIALWIKECGGTIDENNVSDPGFYIAIGIAKHLEQTYARLAAPPAQDIRVAAIPETQLAAMVSTTKSDSLYSMSGNRQYSLLYFAAVKLSTDKRDVSLQSVTASRMPRC